MKVMIAVTHLLGTGHLARALVLARAFMASGHATTLVSGGMPVAHLDVSETDFVQLPPVRSDGVNFSTLLDDGGRPAGPELLAERISLLSETIVHRAPDVLITELFPFGRRILSGEFLSLIKTAQALGNPPLVCASVRDILAPPSKPAKAEVTSDIVAGRYDAVLVHSDARLIPLDASWPVTPGIAEKLHYTGFVAQPAERPLPDTPGREEIIVSAGGGGVGGDLFATALAAAWRDPYRRWRLLIGGQDAKDRSAALMATAPANVTVEPARPDFRRMLWHASASVSMCGYNTALDVIQAGTPAVFVPFDAGGEVEQSLRAKALARQSGIAVLPARALEAEALLDSIDRVLSDAARPPLVQGLDGAQRTVEIVADLVSDPRR